MSTLQEMLAKRRELEKAPSIKNEGQSKLFGIGLPKTGTTSLCQALTILGYKTLHNPIPFRLRYYEGMYTYNKVEWDAIVNCGEHIYPQLDEVYPNSKFILTVRDSESWHKSVSTKLLTKATGKSTARLTRIHLFGSNNYHRGRFEYVYNKHIKDVQEYFEGTDRLLVLNICEGSDPWSDLCDFLGKPHPEEYFPYKNKTK
jgi:hypothetical protein